MGGGGSVTDFTPRRRSGTALSLTSEGLSPTEIGRRLGVPKSTVQYWCRGGRWPSRRRSPPPTCPRCHGLSLDEVQYAYLLGCYLGDGHINIPKRSVAALAASCADDWPSVRGRSQRPWAPSDGCRVTNWATKRTESGVRRYEYPRYHFSNRSEDILALCTDALDLLRIRWRRSRRDMLSVSTRAGVAALDLVVGPKY